MTEFAYLLGDELDVVVRVDEISLGVQRLHVEPQPRRRYSAKLGLAPAAPLSQGNFGEQFPIRQPRAKSTRESIHNTERELLLQYGKYSTCHDKG